MCFTFQLVRNVLKIVFCFVLNSNVTLHSSSVSLFFFDQNWLDGFCSFYSRILRCSMYGNVWFMVFPILITFTQRQVTDYGWCLYFFKSIETCCRFHFSRLWICKGCVKQLCTTATSVPILSNSQLLAVCVCTNWSLSTFGSTQLIRARITRTPHRSIGCCSPPHAMQKCMEALRGSMGTFANN